MLAQVWLPEKSSGAASLDCAESRCAVEHAPLSLKTEKTGAGWSAIHVALSGYRTFGQSISHVRVTERQILRDQ